MNNHKTENCKKEKIKRMADIIYQSLLYIFIATIIVIVFACFDLGKAWDDLKSGSNDAFAHFSLILFRVLLYALPGLIGYLIWKHKKKPASKNAKWFLLIDCYNIQFFVFSLVLAIYELLALDYRLNLDILSKMNSFIFIAGFIISIFIKKEIPLNEMKQLNIDSSFGESEIK